MSDISDLNLQIDELEEKRFQMERSLGIDKAKLEKDIKAYTLTYNDLVESIGVAKTSLATIQRSADSLNVDISNQQAIARQDTDKLQAELDNKEKAFNDNVESTIIKLTRREKKLEGIENDIMLKDNEFKRIADDMERREKDIADVTDKNIELVKTIVEKSDQNTKDADNNAKVKADIDEQGRATADRDKQSTLKSKEIEEMLSDAKIKHTKALLLKAEYVAELEVLDTRGRIVSAQTKQNKLDKQKLADGFRLLRDRQGLLARNIKSAKVKGVVV